jgi:hypothetical protein
MEKSNCTIEDSSVGLITNIGYSEACIAGMELEAVITISLRL